MQSRSARAWDGALIKGTDLGGQITQWQSANGREQLFLSKRAKFQLGTAIRGGIPVIFPQFGAAGPLPRHGLARTLNWLPVAPMGAKRGAAELAWRLQANEATRAVWPESFQLELRTSAEALSFSVSLTVRNTGKVPFSFQAALHTYLAVDDVSQVQLRGLVGCPYRDHVQAGAHGVAMGGPLKIVGEVDRVYHDAPSPLILTEGERRLGIYSSGFTDVVVWNPGPERAASMDDLAENEWRRFLCVEAGVVQTPIELGPGLSFTGSQSFDVL